MATEWGQELAQEQFALGSNQVELKSDQAQHLKTEAQYRRLKALKDAELARKQQELLQEQLNEKELNILLQGIAGCTTILSNISWTSALIMGFCATILVELNVTGENNQFGWLTYILWLCCFITILVLLHPVFIATVCLSDGIFLAYQGQNGRDDVHRSLSGMLAMRVMISRTFLAGFLCFALITLIVLWSKLDNESPFNASGEFVAADYAVGVLACFIWVLAMGSIVRVYRQTKALFQDAGPKIRATKGESPRRAEVEKT